MTSFHQICTLTSTMQVQTLPEGWTCVQDHETGVPYYVSPNKAQWQPPCKLLYPPIKDESIFVAQPDSALLEKEISTDLFQEIYNEIKGSTTLRKVGEQQHVKENEQPQEPPLPDPFDETAICQICCENTPQLMLPCSHVFCRKCIEEWFKKKNICPVCCREQNQNPWLIVDEPSNEEVMDFVVKRIFPPVMKMW